jgi:hypothetical protein
MDPSNIQFGIILKKLWVLEKFLENIQFFLLVATKRISDKDSRTTRHRQT